MKKIFGILGAGVIILSSCGNGAPRADLKNKVDTLSYVMGMANSQGLEQYLIEQLGVDSAYLGDVIKGIKDATGVGDNKKQQAYYAGLQIGSQVNNMFKGINRELAGKDSVEILNTNDFLSGFIGKVNKDSMKLGIDSMMPKIQTMMTDVKTTYLEKEYGQNKKAGEEFLKKNGKKAGVVTLASGVQYKVLKPADGVKPASDQQVKLKYEGKTIDGKVFDGNWDKKDTATMWVSQVVPGFSEALQLMPAGSTWEIYIPQDKAYGTNAAGKIEPFSTLIFKVKLLEVIKKEENK